MLFSDRAFLYRYVPETKEWKEKGRGDMKILEHKITGRTRLLMRREQVLKICCNHYITPQLSMKHLQTSDRTWTWSANDFSEGELVQETFAVKFKTMDQAQKFKGVFDEAQKKSADISTEQLKDVKETKCQEPSTFGEKFKPKEGSWECKGCFARNDVALIKCPCCETIKPGEAAPAITPSLITATTPAAPAFKFGSQGGFQFGTAASTTLPSFGANTSFPSTTPTGFGNGFSFSMGTPSSASPAQPSNLTARSPNISVSSDNEYYEKAEGDNIHFEPVIPLPDKIQVKTGEEDEEVVYCHRAKLFRLVNNEWKERGLGDVKVLRKKDTGKTR